MNGKSPKTIVWYISQRFRNLYFFKGLSAFLISGIPMDNQQRHQAETHRFWGNLPQNRWPGDFSSKMIVWKGSSSEGAGSSFSMFQPIHRFHDRSNLTVPLKSVRWNSKSHGESSSQIQHCNSVKILHIFQNRGYVKLPEGTILLVMTTNHPDEILPMIVTTGYHHFFEEILPFFVSFFSHISMIRPTIRWWNPSDLWLKSAFGCVEPIEGINDQHP